MTDSNHTEQQLTQAVRQLWRSRNSQLSALTPLHLIGYGLLILGAIDLLEILIPPLLMNPRWEFQAFGQIIERVPVPLIGFGFIFLGGKEDRAAWEIKVMEVLSWATLLIGILYFLLLPLGVLNTLRIDRLNRQDITAQTNAVQEQIQQAKEQLATIQTAEELQILVNVLSGADIPPIPAGDTQLDDLKQALTSSLEENEAALEIEARQTLRSRRQDLIETSVKWNLGALITGTLYVLIWRSTVWARQKM